MGQVPCDFILQSIPFPTRLLIVLLNTDLPPSSFVKDIALICYRAVGFSPESWHETYKFFYLKPSAF